MNTPPRLGGDVVQLSGGTGQLGLLSNGLEFRVIFTNGENTLLITSGIIGTAKENGEQVGGSLVLSKDVSEEGTSLSVVPAEAEDGFDEYG